MSSMALATPAMKKKIASAVAAATAAAAAAEAALPKVDLQLFEKPLEQMSNAEIRAMVFLAAVDEWLSERHIRLPRARSHVAIGEDEGAVERHRDEKHLMVRRERRGSASSSQGDHERALLASRGAIEKGAIAAAVASAAVVPEVFGPRQMLDLVQPLGPQSLSGITEAEIEQIFKLLLNNGQADAAPSFPIFQVDKALKKARSRLEVFRSSCCPLLREEKDLSAGEQQCCKFLEAFDQLLLERSRWGQHGTEAVFDGFQKISPEQLLQLAEKLGMNSDSDQLPAIEELAKFMVLLGGDVRNKGTLSQQDAYRMLALTQERRRCQRRLKLCARLQRLARPHVQAPDPRVGVEAFTECLLKLALHRLGSKGLTEIQRGSPAWWKCTWLLTLLGGPYTERTVLMRHASRLSELAKMSDEKAWAPRRPVSRPSSCGAVRAKRATLKVQDLPWLAAGEESESWLQRVQADTTLFEDWWRRVQCCQIQRYVEPLSVLALDEHSLFDNAEIIAPGTTSALTTCPHCKEPRSANGWGSPSCVLCSGVEELCLPVSNHQFAGLVRTTGGRAIARRLSNLPDLEREPTE